MTMWHFTSAIAALAATTVSAVTLPVSVATTGVTLPTDTASPYAPTSVACPSGSLIRQAVGINSREQAYYNKRKPIATTNFKKFMKNTGAKFPALTEAEYPTLALTSSGGGYRALLIGAGVHLAFDDREDGNYSTAGLYQSLTYEAGLSGGSWLLSSIAANGYPTISSLRDNLWESTFTTSSLVPGGVTSLSDVQITEDVAAKYAAGFNVSIVDSYGRMIGYTILYGTAGGDAKRFSDLANSANLTSHDVPFPIITALGVDTAIGQCSPPFNATQYEVSPYEFGSWDEGVNAFAQTKYLGSTIVNGKSESCYIGYDNDAFIFGTSSDIYPDVTCEATDPADENADIATFEATLPAAVNSTSTNPSLPYALYPNPFHNYTHSSLVKNADYLTLADGGLSDQNNPIWPFLHRPDVNVLFVNDNSADTSENYPNGSEIYNTYVQAKLQGLGHRMPVIPFYDTFIAEGLNTRPTFFGCNSTSKEMLAIAFLPNVGYNGYDSGTSTFQVEYPATETIAMINDGAEVGSYNKAEGFGTCLACLAMKKPVAAAAKKLPSACTACFSEFCYN